MLNHVTVCSNGGLASVGRRFVFRLLGRSRPRPLIIHSRVEGKECEISLEFAHPALCAGVRGRGKRTATVPYPLDCHTRGQGLHG